MNCEESRLLGELRTNGKTILELIYKKYDGRKWNGLMWICRK